MNSKKLSRDGVISSDSPNHDGLEAVLIANRTKLLGFFTSRTRNAAEAEEVIQEIFLRLGQTTSAPIAQPLAYLYRIGLNIVIDRTREQRRRSRREEAWSDVGMSRVGGIAIDQSPSPFAALASRQQAQLVASAIATLPLRAGHAFRLHKLDGLSHAEVAAKLGISRSGVEKHIALAFRHLARALGE